MNNFNYPNGRKDMNMAHTMHKQSHYTGYTPALPANPVVAMAYVPFQTDSTTYDEMCAYKAGTLYPALDKPFLGRGVR